MSDAWKQLDDLQRKYTQEIEVRRDLVVTALGTERGVRLTLGARSTQRNVSTMRELAQALLEACAFVEDANPEWAGLL